MGAVVFRLVESGGDLYQMEEAKHADLATAGHQSAQWWSDEHTVAVVVFDGDREDSRYTQRGLEEARYPASWPRPSKKATAAQQAVVEVRGEQVLPPTLFDDPAPKDGPKVGACLCCLGEIPDPPDPAETDRTPSGRVNDLRCPVCGRRIPGVGRVGVYRLYMAYQRRISDEHRQRNRPR